MRDEEEPEEVCMKPLCRQVILVTREALVELK